MKKNKIVKRAESNKSFVIINSALLLLLILSLSANQFIIAKIDQELGVKKFFLGQIINSAFKKSNNNPADSRLSGNIMDDAVKLAVSQGTPDIYGEELGVSFDQVQQSINVMRQYDPTYGKRKKIILTDDELRRYINVGMKISCEYCCGAKSVIRPNGEAACGCAHSKAMRGLLAYLIQNHGDKYTDDELLRELARWKGVYFPKQMIKKLASQLQGDVEFTPDTASLVLDVDLPKYEGGKGAPLPSEIENLPGMVGGC